MKKSKESMKKDEEIIIHRRNKSDMPPSNDFIKKKIISMDDQKRMDEIESEVRLWASDLKDKQYSKAKSKKQSSNNKSKSNHGSYIISTQKRRSSTTATTSEISKENANSNLYSNNTESNTEKRKSQTKIRPIIVKLFNFEDKNETILSKYSARADKKGPTEREKNKKKLLRNYSHKSFDLSPPTPKENPIHNEIPHPKEIVPKKKKKSSKKKFMLKKVLKKKNKVSLIEAKKNTLKSINKDYVMKKFEVLTFDDWKSFPIIVQNPSGCSATVVVHRRYTINDIINEVLKLHKSYLIPASCTIDGMFLASIPLKKDQKLLEYPIVEYIQGVPQIRRLMITLRKSKKTDFNVDVEMAYFVKQTPYI